MKKIIIAAVILIICAGGPKAYAQDAVKNEPTPAVCYQTDAGVSLPAQKGSTPEYKFEEIFEATRMVLAVRKELLEAPVEKLIHVIKNWNDKKINKK